MAEKLVNPDVEVLKRDVDQLKFCSEQPKLHLPELKRIYSTWSEGKRFKNILDYHLQQDYLSYMSKIKEKLHDDSDEWAYIQGKSVFGNTVPILRSNLRYDLLPKTPEQGVDIKRKPAILKATADMGPLTSLTNDFGNAAGLEAVGGPEAAAPAGLILANKIRAEIKNRGSTGKSDVETFLGLNNDEQLKQFLKNIEQGKMRDAFKSNQYSGLSRTMHDNYPNLIGNTELSAPVFGITFGFEKKLLNYESLDVLVTAKFAPTLVLSNIYKTHLIPAPKGKYSLSLDYDRTGVGIVGSLGIEYSKQIKNFNLSLETNVVDKDTGFSFDNVVGQFKLGGKAQFDVGGRELRLGLAGSYETDNTFTVEALAAIGVGSLKIGERSYMVSVVANVTQPILNGNPSIANLNFSQTNLEAQQRLGATLGDAGVVKSMSGMFYAFRRSSELGRGLGDTYGLGGGANMLGNRVELTGEVGLRVLNSNGVLPGFSDVLTKEETKILAPSGALSLKYRF